MTLLLAAPCRDCELVPSKPRLAHGALIGMPSKDIPRSNEASMSRLGILMLVAAATLMGMPQKAVRMGILMIPPPRPSRPEMEPARSEAPRASGVRRNR